MLRHRLSVLYYIFHFCASSSLFILFSPSSNFSSSLDEHLQKDPKFVPFHLTSLLFLLYPPLAELSLFDCCVQKVWLTIGRILFHERNTRIFVLIQELLLLIYTSPPPLCKHQFISLFSPIFCQSYYCYKPRCAYYIRSLLYSTAHK